VSILGKLPQYRRAQGLAIGEKKFTCADKQNYAARNREWGVA